MKKLFFFASAVAMFASCSKDLTEDVAPAFSGENAIYASYEADSETRSHVDGTAAKWDNGDALGVFAAQAGDKTNAYFGYDGTKFVGSLNQVKGEDIFVYYPWSRGMEFATNEHKLTFEIPATQYYNHLYTGGYGSFVSGVVPAVAVAKDVDKKNDVNVTLQPAVSYLSIPIKGVGEVGKVTLSMKVDNTEVKLAGNVTVDLANAPTTKQKNNVNGKEVDDETFFTIDNSALATAEITLDCGDGVALNPETAKYFMFVVPAYLDLSKEVEFTISVYDTDGTGKQEYPRTIDAGKLKSTYRNYILHYDSANITWSKGGAYIISNEYEFLMYADAATNGDTNGADVVEAMWDKNNLRPAVIVKTLDFEDFDTDPRLSNVDDNVADYLKKILAAYVAKGNAIPTIGAGENAGKYTIEGNVDGEPAEINNLKVVGNGMFGGKAKVGNVVSDLVLTGINVEGDYLVTNYADCPVDKNVNTPFETLKNITVKGGSVSGTPAAVVNNAYTRNLDAVTVAQMPTGEGIKYANTLKITNDVETPIATEKSFRKVVGTDSGTGSIVTVTTDGVADFIDAIDIEESNDGKYWFSVVSGYDAEAKTATMSYWTGFVADKVNNDNIYTAEELVYNVTNKTGDIVLTNNIDLRNLPWTASNNAANGDTPYAVSSKQPTPTGATPTVYTISNVKIAEKEVAANAPATQAVAAPRSYYTLFGDNVQVNNVTFDGVTIEVAANATAAVVGVIARTNSKGVNSGVTVKDLYVDIKTGAKLRNEAFGGLYAETADFMLANIVDGALTLKDNATPAANFGSLAGQINITADGSDKTLDLTKAASHTKPFAKINIKVLESAGLKLSSNLLFKGVTADKFNADMFKYWEFENDSDKAKSHGIFVYFGLNEVKDDSKATFIFRYGKMQF